jgi:hypothetical protein
LRSFTLAVRKKKNVERLNISRKDSQTPQKHTTKICNDVDGCRLHSSIAVLRRRSAMVAVWSVPQVCFCSGMSVMPAVRRPALTVGIHVPAIGQYSWRSIGDVISFCSDASWLYFFLSRSPFKHFCSMNNIAFVCKIKKKKKETVHILHNMQTIHFFFP